MDIFKGFKQKIVNNTQKIVSKNLSEKIIDSFKRLINLMDDKYTEYFICRHYNYTGDKRIWNHYSDNNDPHWILHHLLHNYHLDDRCLNSYDVNDMNKYKKRYQSRNPFLLLFKNRFDFFTKKIECFSSCEFYSKHCKKYSRGILINKSILKQIVDSLENKIIDVSKEKQEIVLLQIEKQKLEKEIGDLKKLQLINNLSDLSENDDSKSIKLKAESILNNLRVSHIRFDIKYTYFIRSIKTKKLKIGVTEDIVTRFKGIQGLSPDKLELIGYIPINIERQLHTLFQINKSHNEWFNENPIILEVISQLIKKNVNI